MKAYTDIEQSKKLSKLLPLKSADMAWYSSYAKEGYSIRMLNDTYPLDIIGEEHDEIPCWSLAALLNIIPYPTLCKHANETWSCASWVEKINPYFVKSCDSPINACYEMILKLHEQKLL